MAAPAEELRPALHQLDADEPCELGLEDSSPAPSFSSLTLRGVLDVSARERFLRKPLRCMTQPTALTIDVASSASPSVQIGPERSLCDASGAANGVGPSGSGKDGVGGADGI